MLTFKLIRCSCLSNAPTTGSLQILSQVKNVNNLIGKRILSTESRNAFSRRTFRRGAIKEMIKESPSAKSLDIGKGVLAGASAIGIGALCYYGIGLSNEAGAVDKMMLWPDYVKTRIRDTYMYFAGSVAITGASAISVFRSPTMMKFLTKNSLLSIGATIAAMIGSGILVQSIPYEPGFGAKQLAWMLHSAVVGCVISPAVYIGGPIVMKAVWYTAGVIGGLSTVAVCAPSNKFLNMAGPLAIGLGVVFVSSIGSMFLPPTTALGVGLYSISLYGGLALFSMFLLYDTQKIIYRAENQPYKAYDPVNNSISIYIDTINIFVRMLAILSGGGGRKK